MTLKKIVHFCIIILFIIKGLFLHVIIFISIYWHELRPPHYFFPYILAHSLTFVRFSITFILLFVEKLLLYQPLNIYNRGVQWTPRSRPQQVEAAKDGTSTCTLFSCLFFKFQLFHNNAA